MSAINPIFQRVHDILHKEGPKDYIAILMNNTEGAQKNQELPNIDYQLVKTFLSKIFKEIDELGTEIKKDNTILVSVRNQKLLRTCLQIVTSLGICQCLIPGLGIELSRRCASAASLPKISMSNQERYNILISCTDFFIRCYEVPVLRTIILTFHMCDYLSALIQLSFAPLKKPGTYQNYVMTQEMYDQLTLERQKYVQVYEHLVNNCFQPILMKELLVLQSVSNPHPPMFVKRVIAREMDRRMLAPGGLLSLIRCFIESHTIDTGLEWNKIDIICKIVVSRHGNETEDSYLDNICTQLSQILTLNDTNYLATAVACVLSLKDTYRLSDKVEALSTQIFKAFDYDYLLSKSNLPGTLILTHQEIEHKVNIFHACCTTVLECPVNLLMPNLDILISLAIKSYANQNLNMKLNCIIYKTLGLLDKKDVFNILKKALFGHPESQICVEEYGTGLGIKHVTSKSPDHAMTEATIYFLYLIRESSDTTFVKKVFESFLTILSKLWSTRINKTTLNHEVLQEDREICDEIDEKYAYMLHTLSELITLPTIEAALKQDPSIVLDFIECVLNNETDPNDDCTTISLVYLNTVLIPNSVDVVVKIRLKNLIPALTRLSEMNFINNNLCREALSMISKKTSKYPESACDKAISDVFDSLLPVRAHGIMELTKLIDSQDAETISKKHYLFCLFQTQLKDPDTYIYLSTINAIASLGTHCTEDVLHVLCGEFLELSSKDPQLETKADQDKIAETRLKIGDVIVKVTKRLGEMAIVHKTILINTMLSGTRDLDPLIRTSALSNLAEIVLVLHYKVGTILYEILQCIMDVLDTDKAIECRRAAVMVVSSLLKGLGRETLHANKDYILPLYRILKKIYSDENEDSTVRLHAQIGLEELDAVVKGFLFPEVKMQKQIFVLDKPPDNFK